MAFFDSALGLQRGDDDATVVLDTRDEHQVLPGTIHFAVLTTLAEVAAAASVGAGVVPSSVNRQLLRRARPGRLTGHGTLPRRGRRLAVAEGEVRQDAEQVAKATLQFAILS